MARIHFYLFGLLVGLAPLAARAASVDVTYQVDGKALKGAVSGTNLTFSLYSDAACTALVHSQVVAIDALSSISQLKLFKPKGGTKPPKTATLKSSLTGVTPTAPLYLQVTGTGITAVGGNCQMQTAMAPPPRSTMVVVDANGRMVGPYDNYTQYVFLSGERPVGAYIQPDTGFGEGANLYYESSDCSGTALLQTSSNFVTYGVQANGTLYYPPMAGAVTTTNSQLSFPSLEVHCFGPGATFIPPSSCCCSGACFGSPTLGVYGPALSLDVSQFTPPFHVEIR